MWLESQWGHMPLGVASNTYQTGKMLIRDSNFFHFLKRLCWKILLIFIWNYVCRLSGAAFVVPVVNYRWPSFPDNLIRGDYRRKLVQCALWVANYTPGLLYWWVTQKWLPSTSSVMERKPVFFNSRDVEVLKTTKGFPMLTPVTENISTLVDLDSLLKNINVSWFLLV